MSKSSGRIWPYAIGISITIVFGFCVATIMVTQKANIQESDAYMTHYQDANANDLIKAQIAFDKKYKVEYLTQKILESGTIIKYKVTDADANPVNDAKIIIATSRPDSDEFNEKLENPKVQNGVYSFEGASFPKVGIWNIIAKVEAGKESRFFNIKTDTRTQEAFEF
jgi:cell division protein FtsX